MKNSTRKSLLVAPAFFAIAGLAACGGTSSGSTAAAPTSAATSAASASPSAMAASTMVGSGCAGYAAKVPSGAGSVEGMAQDPVATAASNNPLLKTLTAAVSGKLNKKVDLVDTLNGGEFTVFAPVDDAFAKIPKKTLTKVVANAKTLSTILTYHVVAGQIAPDAIAGSHKTVEGSSLKVTGSGDNLKVNGANVICGGVKTANATVYLIDTVLMPPAKK